MNEKAISAALIAGLMLFAVFVYSLVRWQSSNRDISREKQSNIQIQRIISACMLRHEPPSSESVTEDKADWAMDWLGRYLLHEQQELDATASDREESSIEIMEIHVLQGIIDSLRLRRFSEARRGILQLAAIEMREMFFLKDKMQLWSSIALWTGIGFASLLLVYLVLISTTYLRGDIRATSLSDAQMRFGLGDVATNYVVKRKEVETFESRVIAETLRLHPQTREMLDIPCGTGRFVKTFVKLNLNYYGADYSQAMVDLARTRPELPDASCVIQCNISDMPCCDKSFDCVFVARLFHHIGSSNERLKIFRELRRVTREGIAFSFFDSRSLSHLYYILKKALYMKPLNRHAVSVARLRKELTTAGLKVEKVIYRSRGLHRYAFIIATPAS